MQVLRYDLHVQFVATSATPPVFAKCKNLILQGMPASDTTYVLEIEV